MKALTLWPEWCFAITHLDKRVENRVWEPPKGMIGQRIAIHAGANIGATTSYAGRLSGLQEMLRMAELACWDVKYDGASQHALSKGPSWVVECGFDKITTSAIVATARLAGCSPLHWSDAKFADENGVVRQLPIPNKEDLAPVVASGWQVHGQFHWLLEDVHVLRMPIPCKGKQKLWTVERSIAKRLEREYEESQRD